MSSIPDKIYLQWYGDEEPNDEETVDEFVTEVTWCKDKIYKHDIAYIREDKAEISRLLKAIEDAPCDSWCASLGNGHQRYKCNCWKSKLGEQNG